MHIVIRIAGSVRDARNISDLDDVARSRKHRACHTSDRMRRGPRSCFSREDCRSMTLLPPHAPYLTPPILLLIVFNHNIVPPSLEPVLPYAEDNDTDECHTTNHTTNNGTDVRARRSR